MPKLLDGLPYDAALLFLGSAVIPVSFGGTVSYRSEGGTTEFISSLGARSVFARGADVRSWDFKCGMPHKFIRHAHAFSRMSDASGFLVSPFARHTNFLAALPSTSSSWKGSTSSVSVVRSGVSYFDGFPMEVFQLSGGIVEGGATPVVPGSIVSFQGFVSNGFMRLNGYNGSGTQVWTSDAATNQSVALSRVEKLGIEIPSDKGIVYVREAYKGSSFSGGQLWYGSSPALLSAREGAWVTMEDFSYDHGVFTQGNIINVSFKLKEVYNS